MERPHVAAQHFLPVLLSPAEIPEPGASQAGNGKADCRLSSGQAGVHQEPDDYGIFGAFRQHGFYRKQAGKLYHHEHSEIPHGAWQRLCLCSPPAAHSYRKRGLLHRPRVLQLYPQMLCAGGSENQQNHPSGRRADGYVHPYV